MDDRVKYYPSNDLLHGYNLSKIETLQIPSVNEININDAIEFFQIKRYFDAETRSRTWSDEAYEEYKAKCDSLFGLTKRFFNQINDNNIIDYYKNLDDDYRPEFWVLFDNCKLSTRISEDMFERLITREKVSPRDLFLHKNIVRNYGNVLKNYIIQNEFCISVVLHVYEQDYTDSEKWFLPVELTKEDVCNYIDHYLDAEHPNVNYLRDIRDMRSRNQFLITDEIRLKAKRRYAKELEKLSETSIKMHQDIQIIFSLEQVEEKRVAYNDHVFSVSYSVNWLLDTLDYPSILNNFIYLFGFVDVPQMRCSHVNRISQSGVIERTFATKSLKKYPHNNAFAFSNRMAALQMQTYYEFLERQNIRLEDVIKWFFTEQIQSEFGCSEIRLSMPSRNSSYAEKCSSILIAFESIIKQYSIYAKNGEIDFELLGMSSTPIVFANINSMVADKYIYGVGDDFKRLSFWLFSDQCMLLYNERIYEKGRNYDCLLDLLLKETVYVSDYQADAYSAFENMASFDLISIDATGKIMPKDKAKLAILRDLANNDVISQWHYSLDVRYAITDFIEKGLLESRSTLFSQPEIDYLNYLLNRAEYDNGLEIRNRYIHGIQQINLDEDEHRQNYFVLLRLFVLLAIKVNDDFCLKEAKESEMV